MKVHVKHRVLWLGPFVALAALRCNAEGAADKGRKQDIIDQLIAQVRPKKRFEGHAPRFTVSQREIRFNTMKGEERKQQIYVLRDHELVIGVWPQGSNPWHRRFDLITQRPGKGLNHDQFLERLRKHVAPWGYDPMWTHDGIKFATGIWLPSAEAPCEDVRGQAEALPDKIVFKNTRRWRPNGPIR